jgi:beta-glucosidase
VKYFTKASFSNLETERERVHRSLAYDAACESIVLLENDGVLPLRPGNIALYGGGGLYTIKGGTGSGEVNERKSVTIYEGLINAGFVVTNKSWLADYSLEYEKALADYQLKLARMVRTFRIGRIMNALSEQFVMPCGRDVSNIDADESDTDTALYVVSRQAGEGRDRRLDKGENDLVQAEISHLRQLCRLYKTVILILNVGGSMDLSALEKVSGLNALIFFCQQGMEGGTALADILCGKKSPSGRLAATWAGKYNDFPHAQEYSYLNGNLTDELYKEGIYVGYRYFDSFKVKPRYEFGYGLSYSDTEISVAGASVLGTQIKVETVVKNSGIFPAKEVVQLYVSCPEGKLQREYQHLAAFGKTQTIAAGEQTNLTLKFDLKDLAAYDEQFSIHLLEKGEYLIRVGHSSRRTQLAAYAVLTNDAVVSRHQPVCPLRKKFDELSPSQSGRQAEPVKHYSQINESDMNKKLSGSGVIMLKIESADIITVIHDYMEPVQIHDENTDAIMNQLTVKEMVDIVVGAGMFFGRNKFNVPGSVGNTTSRFYKIGLINVALCDGPAGLRLAREAGRLKTGNIKPYQMPVSFLESLPLIIKRRITANPKNSTPVYQFATAFPVAMALAQSWNAELLERIGQAVGVEMEEYGVAFWLAPAMNIQRNPLCGRNFEYYSEDPLLTGKCAAAMVRGVQKKAGIYATIKHICCNNQEDNRNFVSSHVHERALREIYLKGFAIAVREGGPGAAMTSYNKVNDIYAPESYDLCTRVLRNEWGFDGVVMTDWMSTGRNKASAAKALAAGNDLIMAGLPWDKRDIHRAYKRKSLPEEVIRRCCANVVHSIVNSKISREIKAGYEKI